MEPSHNREIDTTRYSSVLRYQGYLSCSTSLVSTPANDGIHLSTMTKNDDNNRNQNNDDDDGFIDSLLDQATSYITRQRQRNQNAHDNDDHITAFGTRNPLNFALPAAKLTSLTAASTDPRGKTNSPIEIQYHVQTKGGGRGIFATRDIRAGERVIVAKPLVLVMDGECGEDDDDDQVEEEEDGDEEGDVFAFLEGDDDDGNSSGSEDGPEEGGSDSEEEEEIDLPSKKKFKSDVEMAFKNPGNDDPHDGDGKKDIEKTIRGKHTSEDKDEENVHEDHKDDEDAIDPTGTKRNALIILHLLHLLRQHPTLWTDTLSQLYPRDEETALQLPLWMCRDPALGMQIEREMEKLSSPSDTSSSSLLLFDKDATKNEEICHQIKVRLPLVVRYNVLSVETSSELFVYPDGNNGGMMELAGTGLFGPEVSFLNHSHVPNLSRYAIGDVMFFVANRDITKGDELCFSYIEHELLCESAERRTALLDMDFQEYEDDDKDGHNDDDDDDDECRRNRAGNGKNGNHTRNKRSKFKARNNNENENQITFPLIDTDLQTELMSTPPLERLELLQELLDVSTASATDSNMESPIDDYYQCDKHQLRILRAITLDTLGRSAEALQDWEKCVEFAVEKFPPVDETTIALRVQLALCARSLVGEKLSVKMEQAKKSKKRKKNQEKGDCGVMDADVDVEKIARENAKEALRMHDLLFGGGRKRFLKRYEKEFLVKMRLRSDEELKKDIEALFGNLQSL